jgi:hypothetical protein
MKVIPVGRQEFEVEVGQLKEKVVHIQHWLVEWGQKQGMKPGDQDRKGEYPSCPRCGLGYDTDGDGHCVVCAHLTAEQVARVRIAELQAELDEARDLRKKC